MNPTDDGGRRRSILRKIATVLVVIILILSLAAVLSPPSGDEGPAPDGEGPHWVDPEPVVIDGDTTWSELTGVQLERPTVVASGAALTIERCNLTVDLLDLVMGNASWLSVEPGALLMLQESRISVTYDPRLEDAVFVPSISLHKGLCSISRAVNLEGTRDPVLSLELLWWRMGTSLVVGVQPRPGSPLQTLAVIEPPDDGERAWRRYDIPLADFSGSVVRVVMFPSDGKGALDLFVGKVLVGDRHGPLLWDELGTGRVWEDMWLMRGFVPFFKDLRQHHAHYHPLLDARGDVRLVDSIIDAPPNLPRSSEIFSPGKFNPSHREPADRGLVSWHSAPTMGHIHMRGASLSIERSSVINIPITMNDGRLDITDSNISGDASLLSVEDTWGSINRTSLEVRERHLIYDGPGAWDYGSGTALSVDYYNASGPLAIRSCNFTGGERGLDLNQAWIELEGCAFAGQSWLAVWDHSSRFVPWPEVLSENTFTGLGNYSYLRTHNTVLELVGPDRPGPGSSGVFTGRISWEGQEDSYEWQVLVRVDVYQAYFLMPVELVDASMRENDIGEVRIDLFNTWGGVDGLWLDTNETYRAVTMDSELAYRFDPYQDSYLEVDEAMGRGPGEVDLTIEVAARREHRENWQVDIALDGALVRTILPADANVSVSGSYDAKAVATVEVPAGYHVVNTTLYGRADEGNEALYTQTLSYMRFDEDVLPDVVIDWTRTGRCALILDPGVALNITGPLAPDQGTGVLQLRTYLWEGAHLTVHDASVPPTALAWFTGVGPGRLDLTDITCGPIVIEAEDADFTLCNATCARLSIELNGGTGRLSNLTASTLRTIIVYAGNLSIEDLTVGAQEGISSCYIYDANASFRHLNLTCNGSAMLDYLLGYSASLAIEGSTFRDCIVTTYGDSPSHRLDLLVEGCTFEGDRSCLVWPHDNMTPTGELAVFAGSRISDNLFKGGAIVCSPEFLDAFFVGNAFEGGVRYLLWSPRAPLVVGAPENASHVHAYVDGDDPSVALGESVMGDYNEQWGGLFATGSLTPPHLTTNTAVHLYLKAQDTETDYFNDWVVDFRTLPLPLKDERLFVIAWEDISTLIAPLIKPS